eukprot:scaffold102905_cov24-Attheya_sp.AAC.1
MPRGELSAVSNLGRTLPTEIGYTIPGADDTSAITEGTRPIPYAACAADIASPSTEATEIQPLPFDADAASLEALSGLTGLCSALSV